MMMIKTWEPLDEDYLSTHTSSVAKSTPFSAVIAHVAIFFLSVFSFVLPNSGNREYYKNRKSERTADCY